MLDIKLASSDIIYNNIKISNANIVDFIPFALQFYSHFYIDKESKYYDIKVEDRLYLFKSDNINNLKSEVTEFFDKAELPLFVIKFEFDYTCYDDEKQSLFYQKINWILEEIYDIANTKSYNTIIDLGKITVYNNIEKTLDSLYSEKKIYILEYIENSLKQNDIGWFDVNIKLEDNVLSAEIIVRNSIADKKTEYYFYLLKYGKIVEKCGWFSNKSYCWNISEDGIYCVQGYVKIGESKSFRRSEALGYFSSKTMSDYKEFLQQEYSDNIPYLKSLKFYNVKYPFADFLIVSQRKKRYSLDSFLDSNSRFEVAEHRSIGGWSTSVVANGGFEKKENNGNIVMFSGTTSFEDRFIIGVNDLPDDIGFDQLAFGYGENSVIEISNDSIRVANDYFNFSKWFYFKTGDMFIISNRYHLLLMILSSFNMKLNIDVDKAVITLSTINIQFLSQNFTRKMDISDLYQLESDKYLVLDNKGWRIDDTPYGKCLRDVSVFHNNQYKALIKQASKEIIENVKLVFKDERFEYVHADLSGGLDSRVIYAAITNLNLKYKEKARIVSYSVPNSNDLPIATEINSIYGFEYDSVPSVQRLLSINDSDQITRSFYLGTYFSFNPYQNVKVQSKCVSVNGACGEILARPYTARKYFGSMAEEDKSSKAFASYLWSDFSANIIAADNKSKVDFQNYVVNEISNIPVKNIFEAYDRMYLQFRHGYHFYSPLSFEYNEPSWMPMQSKTLFQIHHMTYDVFKSIKLQFDLISQLNPLLLLIRFDSDADNFDYTRLKDSIIVNDPRMDNITISGNDDMERWNQADVKKRQAVSSIKTNPLAEIRINNEYRIKSELLYQALKRNFAELMIKSPELSDRIGTALYHYINNSVSSVKDMQFLYNKITSLLDQINIIMPI